VDKTEKNNLLQADITVSNGRLVYKVVNSLHCTNCNGQSKGFGLMNLRKRLELLYPGEFSLDTKKHDHQFMAELKIPV
jgi:two-component system, LytTR family, sensor kinase